MKVSDRGLMFLIGHEGIVQSRYKDAVGVWTIGVGHTAAAGAPDPAKFAGTMTMREVFDLLRRDVAKYEATVSKAVKVPLEQHEFDALVSWHYNTGRIARATWLKALNDGRKNAAFTALEKSIITAGGKVLPALVERRRAESRLALHGTYPKPLAMVYPASPQGKVLWGQGKQVDLVRLLQSEPIGKPAGEQKPVEAPKPAPKPEPAQTTPADGNAGIVGKIVAVIVAAGSGAMLWFGGILCELPNWLINLVGLAGKCGG